MSLNLLQLKKLSPRQYAIIGGGVSLIILTYLQSRGKKRVQVVVKEQNNGKKKVPTAQFYSRLKKILPIIIPRIRSRETGYIVLLAVLLASKFFSSISPIKTITCGFDYFIPYFIFGSGLFLFPIEMTKKQQDY